MTGDVCAAPVNVAVAIIVEFDAWLNVATTSPLLPDGLMRYQIAVRYVLLDDVVDTVTACVMDTPPNVTVSTVNAPLSDVRSPWMRTTRIRLDPAAGV